MRILHVNFAKGFRGGERQTELLIRALADRELLQGILLRRGSPLVERLQDVSRLEILENRKPYVRKLVSPRRFDVCHAHETKAAQWALINRALCRLPYVITRRVAKVPKRDFFTRAMYTKSAATICLSSKIRDDLLQTVPGATTMLVPDMCAGFSVDESLLRRLGEKYRGKYVVGHVGALTMKDKGQHILIEAMRGLRADRDVHCLLVGDGRDRETLEKQAAGLDNVEFLGFQSKVGTYLRFFDAFVFPSLSEGLGSTLIDAMHAGCPIIASRVGGIPELVIHDEHGLLVPPGDAGALRSAIDRMRKSPDLANRLLAAARQRSELFLPERLAGEHIDLYRRVFPEKRG